MKVEQLKCEYRTDPLGIGNTSPRFSWVITANDPGTVQTSYRIRACSDENMEQSVWDSGVVCSSMSQNVRWMGPALQSRQRIYWTVCVCTDNEQGLKKEAVSETARFEIGLTDPCDWTACWIEPEDEVDYDAYKAPSYIRKTFHVEKGLSSARIYATAHGLYQFFLNGTAGTEDRFKPGYTSYYHRLQVQTYDITGLLQPGENTLGVILGDGWWRGSSGGCIFNNYGYKTAFLAQIELYYEDGRKEIIGTDGTERTATGGLLKSDMKFGDVFDARLEPEHWKTTDFDDRNWKKVNIADPGLEQLIMTETEPVRKHEFFEGKELHTPNGERILDFGQNMAGHIICRFHDLKAGQKIRMVHGELLDHKGNFTIQNMVIRGNLQGTIQEITYIAKGLPEETYEPEFCIFGFRYLLIEGYEEKINSGDFTAAAVYSSLEETGDFHCSNKDINQLVSNARWSQKSNFLDVPTDCPTRERNTWTGDAQIYVNTAARFMNVYPFFEKWMKEFNCEQFSSGKIPNTVPSTDDYHNREEIIRQKSRKDSTYLTKLQFERLEGEDNGTVQEGSAGWCDAAVLIPWRLYLAYGDETILRNQYDCAKKLVDYEIARAKLQNPIYKKLPQYQNCTDGIPDAEYIWDLDFHWGEHLDAEGSTELMMAYLTSLGNLSKFFRKKAAKGVPLVATAYMAYSSKILSEMARVLGKEDDADFYSRYSDKVKAVYDRYFIPENGYIGKTMQAPNVRVLALNIVSSEKREAVTSALIEKIHKAKDHLNTGFLSTPFILPVLADCGEIELAYTLLQQERSPGWLAAVKQGATTIPESWDNYMKLMGSVNHYSIGAVCEFLFGYVAGIMPDPEKPGYRHFYIRPYPGGNLTYAEAVQECPYGTIRSCWKVVGDKIQYSFTIPCNTTADVILPDGTRHVCGSGTWEFIINK